MNMIHGFPISFIQVALEQTLLKLHNDNPNLVGGKNQIEIHSFYEQLKTQDEVNRFVETFRDLTEQQNRSGLIANGILMSPENPTITNLYTSMIIPMSWACSLRVKLSDRDLMLETINALIEELKGSKVDIAELKCRDEQGRAIYVPFAVGTIGHNPNAPVVKCGDYIGTIEDTQDIQDIIDNLAANNVIVPQTLGSWFYATNDEGKLKVMVLTEDGLVFKEDDGTYPDIIFPPEHESFEKYKLSLSFEGLRCDTPRTLNGNEYCEISFGGSATLVNESVKLGNDLIKISMQKNKILAQTSITFSNDTVHYLEPLELPSGNGANTIPNQLTSNVFKVNTHTDSLTATFQYTFILDEQQALLKQLFKYGRYGTVIPNTSGISPNMIFNVDEWWSAWGVVDKETYLGKLIESIDIENTESDTLTLSITMQVQGANN
jgi:hypothetical protein